LSRKYDIARNLIRIWVLKHEGGEFEPGGQPLGDAKVVQKKAVMRSLSRRESTARGRKTAAKKPVRKTKRKAPRKTSRKKRL
jgi:hypothetical protein